MLGGARLHPLLTEIIIVFRGIKISGKTIATQKLRILGACFPGPAFAKKAFDYSQPEGLYLNHRQEAMQESVLE